MTENSDGKNFGRKEQLKTGPRPNRFEEMMKNDKSLLREAKRIENEFERAEAEQAGDTPPAHVIDFLSKLDETKLKKLEQLLGD